MMVVRKLEAKSETERIHEIQLLEWCRSILILAWSFSPTIFDVHL